MVPNHQTAKGSTHMDAAETVNHDEHDGASLSERDRAILRLRFEDGLSQAEIGRHRAAMSRAIGGAFVTEGDPSLFSTFIYLQREAPQRAEVQLVDGHGRVVAVARGAMLHPVRVVPPVLEIPHLRGRGRRQRTIRRERERLASISLPVAA